MNKAKLWLPTAFFVKINIEYFFQFIFKVLHVRLLETNSHFNAFSRWKEEIIFNDEWRSRLVFVMKRYNIFIFSQNEFMYITLYDILHDTI